MEKELTHRTITYREIKDFVNQLSEKQLKQEAMIWISDDDSPTEINAIGELGEDYYTFPGHECSCTQSTFKEVIIVDDNNQQYKTFGEAIAKEDFYVTPADTVYFYNY
jgi:hypothetical protein